MAICAKITVKNPINVSKPYKFRANGYPLDLGLGGPLRAGLFVTSPHPTAQDQPFVVGFPLLSLADQVSPHYFPDTFNYFLLDAFQETLLPSSPNKLHTFLDHGLILQYSVMT